MKKVTLVNKITSMLVAVTMLCMAAIIERVDAAAEFTVTDWAYVTSTDPDAVQSVGTNSEIYSYSKPLNDVTIERRGFLRFDAVENYSDVAYAQLSIYTYWSNSFTGEVFSPQSEWDASTLIYSNMPSLVHIANMKSDADFTSGSKWRVFDVTDYVRRNGGSALSFAVTFKSSNPQTHHQAKAYLKTGSYTPKLEIIYDEAPTVTDASIKGNSIESFTLEADYTYNKSYYDEGETEFEWYSYDAADDDEENGTLITTGVSGKTLTIDSSLENKYIRVKITPYAQDGKYKKGGSGEATAVYTEAVGPIRAITYLDELAAQVPDQTDADALYNYLDANENILNLGLADVDAAYIDIVMGNILADAPASYQQLKKSFDANVLVQKIDNADSSDIAAMLEEDVLELELAEFNNSDKDEVCSILAASSFTTLDALKTELEKALLVSAVNSMTDKAAIAAKLNSSPLLTDTLADTSYGILLEAGEYMAQNGLDEVTDFDSLCALLETALVYGEENFEGGYITMKEYFSSEAYVKTDYTNSLDGENSVPASAQSYLLFGNKNVENYKSYAALRFDLSKIVDYQIYSAKMKFYAMVNGGADKEIKIQETGEFADGADFVDKYPTGVDIVFGNDIGSTTGSYADRYQWKEIDVTDFINEKVSSGDENAYLIINYVGFTSGSEINKNLTVYSQSAGGEYTPYIEIIYETPPTAKNISVSGLKATGATVEAKYDYSGCNEEGSSVFEWYSADYTGESYVNVQKISGATGRSFSIPESLAGKHLMVKVKPRAASGAYTEGEFYPSAYTEAVLGTAEKTALLGEINTAADAVALKGVITPQNDVLDLDLALEFLSESGRESFFNVLVNKEHGSLNSFKDYYEKYANVVSLNEAESSEIDGILNSKDFGVTLTRYNAFEDKTDVINKLYNKNFQTVESFVQTFNEACAVKEFDGAVHSNAVELLTAYNFMFTNSLSSYDADELALIGNYFMTYVPEAVTAFSQINSAVTSAVNAFGSYVPSVPDSGDDNSSDSNTNISINGGSGSSGGGGNRVVSVPASSGDSGGFTPVQSSVFDDLDSVYSWAGTAIGELYKKGIVNGDGNGNFRPNDFLTREEFVKMLAEAFDVEKAGECSFDDVSTDAWYYPYIGAALSAGIITGESDSLFGTGKNVTRQDMSTMLYRAMRIKSLIEPTENSFGFDDGSEISTYALEAVNALAEKKIINGIGDNKFAPMQYATRAMAAVMIYNALK